MGWRAGDWKRAASLTRLRNFRSAAALCSPSVLEAPMSDLDNPKVNPIPESNGRKDPDDWVSGDDPMTGAQASYLKTLSEEAGEPEAYADNLSKAEASKRIDALREQLGR
jgi:hypothetical protein